MLNHSPNHWGPMFAEYLERALIALKLVPLFAAGALICLLVGLGVFISIVIQVWLDIRDERLQPLDSTESPPSTGPLVERRRNRG